MDISPDMLRTGGFGLAVLFALSYGIIYVGGAPSVTRTFLKTASIGLLAIVSLLAGGLAVLTSALALSALGDAFLSRDGERNFLFGLISFLLAHIAYIILFFGTGKGLAVSGDSLWIYAIGFAIILSAADTLRRLWPNLNALRWPVVVYTGAICIMGLAALTLIYKPFVIAGALMFMMSDTILAHEQFFWPDQHPIRRYSPYAVWTLYFVGQALIAWAFLAG